MQYRPVREGFFRQKPVEGWRFAERKYPYYTHRHERFARQAAINYFRKSLELATIQSEQMFLSKKLQELGDPRESAGSTGRDRLD